MRLLTPSELDSILRYPHGRALRLARKGALVHIVLPDGQVRFRPADVETLLGVKLAPEPRPAVNVSDTTGGTDGQ